MNIYDNALHILQDCFNNTHSIIEAKTQSEGALLELLQKHKDAENDIRLAILHFYDQCGLDAFVHYDKKELHIITRIKNQQHNIYVQRICDFLTKHKAKLYEREPSKEDFEEFFQYVDSILDVQCESTKRDLIKIALRNVFGIQPRDALFFKDGSIKLKKFDYEIVQINKEVRDIDDKAHMFILSNEHKTSIDKALESINIQSLIMQNTLQILQNDIHLAQIDVLGFNKKFHFFAIQKMRIFLESLPLGHIDSIQKTIYCLSLVQKYAWVMFEVVAKELLDLCAKDDPNALNFVGFYNGSSIELNKKIYTKPLIVDKNGDPWTLPLIKETLHNKASVEFDIQNLQMQISNTQERILNITSSLAQEELKHKVNIVKVESCNDTLETKNRELRILVDKQVAKSKIDALSEEINTNILEKSKALGEVENTQKHINALNEEHIALLSLQERLQGQVSYALKKNKDKFSRYDLLLRALANAIENAKNLV
ncbi:hypothetical protein [Helicobacter typhlonius]|uniref:hypothetical protein n=1 Tax=Helicobacter typhlonius TaxID=76936 RepID=UPI002FE0E86F